MAVSGIGLLVLQGRLTWDMAPAFGDASMPHVCSSHEIGGGYIWSWANRNRDLS